MSETCGGLAKGCKRARRSEVTNANKERRQGRSPEVEYQPAFSHLPLENEEVRD